MKHFQVIHCHLQDLGLLQLRGALCVQKTESEGLQRASHSPPCGVISPYSLNVPIFLPPHHCLQLGFCFGQHLPNKQILFAPILVCMPTALLSILPRNPSFPGLPRHRFFWLLHSPCFACPLKWGCSPVGAGSLSSLGTFSPGGLSYLRGFRVPSPECHSAYPPPPRPAFLGIRPHTHHTQDLAHRLSPKALALPLFSLLSKVCYASSTLVSQVKPESDSRHELLRAGTRPRPRLGHAQFPYLGNRHDHPMGSF